MITKEEYVEAKKSLRRDKLDTILDGKKRVDENDERYKLIEEYEVQETFSSMFPIARNIAATTIGLDLVSVKPILFTKEEYVEAKKSLRRDKFNTILDGENRIDENDERYGIIKSYEEFGEPPKSKLYYFDYEYNDKKEINNIN